MVRALGEEYITKNILPYTQLRRLIRPEEIADAICFMIANSAVSGELWADAGCHAPPNTSGVQPFFRRNAGLAQDSPNKSRINRAAVRIRYGEAQTAPAHPLVLSSWERPVEAQGLQLANQLTP
jgi:hypothetical protein